MYLDYATALAEVDIARRGLPNNASVFCATRLHRIGGKVAGRNCVRDLERAVQLDPRSVWLLTVYRSVYQSLRRFPEAATARDRVLAVVSGDSSTRVWRALVDLDSHAERNLHTKLFRTL